MCKPIEDGHGNKGKIGNYPISCNTYISCNIKDQHVKDNGDDRGRKIANKGRNSKLAAGKNVSEGRCFPVKSYLIFAAVKVGSADEHSNGWADSSGKCGTGKPKSYRKHKNVIEHNVEQTSGDCTSHRTGCSLIISCKCSESVIGHKKWGCDQHNAKIIFAKLRQMLVSAKEPEEFFREKNSCQNKRNTAEQGPENGLGKVKACVFLLCLVDGISGGRTNSNHGTDGIDKSVNWQNQIQNCKPVCS